MSSKSKTNKPPKSKLVFIIMQMGNPMAVISRPAQAAEWAENNSTYLASVWPVLDGKVLASRKVGIDALLTGDFSKVEGIEGE